MRFFCYPAFLPGIFGTSLSHKKTPVIGSRGFEREVETADMYTLVDLHICMPEMQKSSRSITIFYLWLSEYSHECVLSSFFLFCDAVFSVRFYANSDCCSYLSPVRGKRVKSFFAHLPLLILQYNTQRLQSQYTHENYGYIVRGKPDRGRLFQGNRPVPDGQAALFFPPIPGN